MLPLGDACGSVPLRRVITPALPAQAYKSYAMRYPLNSHWRKATCAEFGCRDYQRGFVAHVDTSTPLGQAQYDYLTRDKTRSPVAEKTSEHTFSFTYPPGTQPFASPAHDHRVKADRPPLLLVVGGDWRGNPHGVQTTVHRSAEDWQDDFATHQDRLARATR